MSRKQLKSLVNEIDRRRETMEGPKSTRNIPDREFARWDFAIETVPVQLHHPGGSSVKLRLAARNLSAGGVGLLHNGFVHTDSRVSVWLPLRLGGTMSVNGRIVRCSHLGGVVHDLGVQFDRPIDLQLVRTNDGDWFTLERVDPSMLEGRLIYVGGSDVTRNVFRNNLRNTQLRMAEADTIEKGKEELARECDVIVYDLTSNSDVSIAVQEEISTTGGGAPCIAVYSRDNAESQMVAERLQPVGTIPVPVDELTMLRALAEILIVRKEQLREAG